MNGPRRRPSRSSADRLPHAAQLLLLCEGARHHVPSSPVGHGKGGVRSSLIPLELFSNRTSAIAYVLAVLSAMLLQWVTYYLPIYFQAIHLSSPRAAGIHFLPLMCALVRFGIATGVAISATGKYIPVHNASFVLISNAFGLFARRDQDTPTAEGAGLRILAAADLSLTMASPPRRDTGLTAGFLFSECPIHVRLRQELCLRLGYHHTSRRVQWLRERPPRPTRGRSSAGSSEPGGRRWDSPHQSSCCRWDRGLGNSLWPCSLTR
ncbi:hypothetical protein F4778DRAFT_751691 [Xylariomycetidae sp. FL2044]|nr:hypothetical protein F4778DRAFT_751691 [Xylariomycetidae sp. FL2044]